MRSNCRTAKIIAVCLLLGALPILSFAQEAKATRASTPLSFRGDFSAAGLVVPSENDLDGRPLLAAAGLSLGLGLELRAGQWIPLRSQLSYYSTGRSAIDESLFLYRAFLGWRWALETGYGFKLGKLELDLLGGGAISASEYAGTALVSAYYSIVAEPRLLIPVQLKKVPGFAITASIPFEYMWRGSTRTFAAGLAAGVSIPLGKGAAK